MRYDSIWTKCLICFVFTHILTLKRILPLNFLNESLEINWLFINEGYYEFTELLMTEK